MVNLTKTLTGTLLGFLMAVVMAMSVLAGNLQKITNSGSDKVAIKGYDSVAYFTEGRPMKGKPEFVYLWNDAQWHFTNAAHRDLFVADPEHYAPQFGGFCSMAVTASELTTGV